MPVAKEELALDALGKRAEAKTWQAMVRAMVDAGLLAQRVVIKPPSAKPKMVSAYRLAQEQPTDPPRQGATRQLAVLAYLAQRHAAGHAMGGSERDHQPNRRQQQRDAFLGGQGVPGTFRAATLA